MVHVLLLILCFSNNNIDGLLLPVSSLALSNFFSSALSLEERRRQTLKDELFDLLDRSSTPGTKDFATQEDAIRFEELFSTELPSVNPTRNPAQSPLFSGTYECLWTDEKEINFLIRSGLFGQKWMRTYQKIDIPNNRLENYIVFENDSNLTVGSTIQPADTNDDDNNNGSRFNIQFCDASVSWYGIRIPIPPIGNGWGELLYLDNDIRLQRDIRGDSIVAKRINS